MNAEKPDLFQQFLGIINALNQYKVEYIVIGGVAVIIHGLPRLTQDLDILIKMVPENIGRLREALHSIFSDKDIDEITYDEMKKYSVIRYGSAEGFYLDLMANIGESSDYNSVQAEYKEIEGVKARIATAESLFNLKKASIRPEDQRDALFLKNLLEKQKKE